MTDTPEALRQRLNALREVARGLLVQPSSQSLLQQVYTTIATCKNELQRQGVAVDDLLEDGAIIEAAPSDGVRMVLHQQGGNHFGGGAQIGQIGVIAAGDYIVNHASQLPASTDLECAFALLTSMPDAPDAPLPPPDTFAASNVPRLMPLARNELFVGRGVELRALARWLKVGGEIVIITGVGGVGKTQQATALLNNYWVLSEEYGQEATWTRLHRALTAARRLPDSAAEADLLL